MAEAKCDHISVIILYMSSEVTGLVTVESTEVAEDTVGLLSTLLSRRDDPTDEFSVVGAFAMVLSEGGLATPDGVLWPFSAGRLVSVMVGILPSSTCNDEPPIGDD